MPTSDVQRHIGESPDCGARARTTRLILHSLEYLGSLNQAKVRLDQEPASSRGPHGIQELAEFQLEPIAVDGQRLCRRENLRGSRAGLAGAALHVSDV